MIDGFLARKLGCESRLGLLLDAMGDKLLAGSVWIALWAVGFAPWWLVLPIVVRDTVVVLGWTSVHRGVGFHSR